MNKLQKFEEMAGFPHVIQAEFNEVFRQDYHLKGNWNKLFFGNDNPIVLELGCGKGEYTVELARRFPEKNFIGIDIKGARMHVGASQSFRESLKNVAFIRTHIEMVDSFFTNNEIDEIWLTFPDPQMQKTRKRLTSTRFLALYSKLLKQNGEIHLKTDSNFLFTYTTALIKENQFMVLEEYTDIDKQSSTESILLSIRTYYEQRFLSHNIPIKYCRFILDQSLPFRELDIEIPLDSYHNAGRSVKLYNRAVK